MGRQLPLPINGPEPVSSPVSSIVQQQRPTLDELKQLTKKINEQLSKSASSDEALANLASA